MAYNKGPHMELKLGIDRLLDEKAKLRERLEALADAADVVGVKYFDTDTMPPEVEDMQRATQTARALLKSL